ncbi:MULTISPECIES: IclR family transcriptional regulator [unclassified Polaromonas]|uniref:IclR family transcriptional regulator n=1 Tax=unclassified Polaromonas TaxID=2638319 RepID=UPI0018CACF5D|nr:MULTISPECIES: IclR family transcriptional regulator [unclassified Polaromonas]MBG6072517.1 DNA-binding IclR family transcriptional regulator [Polaromonas sp. CG_9.7]MBG6114521.1 DNA-binding IclR family transcriptional regulator [Polaromonas sp. CG_9.2]MDH6185525.1 DNA-binding IclR family transcriptional regulator [Polaromonas sp. CG_23.6]
MTKKNTSTSTSSTGSSAERSLRLLARLAREGRALSLADLAADLALPKGTAHRLCAQLLETGFIARDINERDFVVGPALRKLSFDTLTHGTVRGLRHQVLTELVKEVGETCNFTTLDGASVLYLDRVEAPWPWRLTLEVGEHVPLHCTASGKMFMALMPARQRELLISELSLTAMTDATITSRAQLLQECESIARAGYSLDRQEFIDGLLALAVPVWDENGIMRAALAVHAPVSRLSAEQALQRLPALQAAAQRLSRLL